MVLHRPYNVIFHISQALYSTIFKTYKTDLDGITHQLGFSKRNFAEWGGEVSRVFKESEGLGDKFKNTLYAMFSAQSKEGIGLLKNNSGDIVSKENIDSYIPKLDTKSARKKLKKLQDIQTEINATMGSWDDHENLFKNGQEYLLNYAKQNDVLASSVDDVKKANIEARTSAIAQNESLKAQTLSARAGSVAFSALATAGNMLASWAIGEAINLIYSCATASDRLLEDASELGSQFSSTKSDINGYKAEIDNLYKIINDNSSSYEETYNARQELLSLQDEMIAKFGSEAEAAKLVTDAINGQTGALDTLTEREWQEAKNAFKSGSGKSWTEKAGDSWSNFWSGSTDNFDRMKKEMENAKVTFFIDQKFDKYGEFKKRLKDLFGAETNSSNSQRHQFEGGLAAQPPTDFTLSGSLNEVYDKLLNIQSLAKNMGIDETFLNDLSEQTAKTKEKLDGYNELYSQSVLYDEIYPNEDYKKSFDEIKREHQKFQNIYASGDESAIADARQSYAETVQNAIAGIEDQSVIDYFNNMYPELRESVGSWEFEVKFKTALSDDSDNFENDVKDAVNSFNTSEEILNFDSKNATGDQIDDYTELQLIADKYNLTLEELINKMIEMGLVASQSKEDLLNRLLPDKSSTAGAGNLFQDSLNQINVATLTDWVNSLSQEDTLLANSEEFEAALESQKEKLNGAALSIDNYNAALEKIKSQKNGEEQINSPLPFRQAWNSLDTTENESLNSMKGNLLTLAGTGQLTSDTFNETEGSSTFLSMLGIEPDDNEKIEALILQINELKSSSEQLSSMKNGISDLSDNLSYREENPGEAISSDVLAGMDSGLKEQTAEWEQYQSVLGNAGSSMDEVREATNKLASAYINSNNFLANLTEANKDYYVSQLEAMDVENAEAFVQDELCRKYDQARLMEEAENIAENDLLNTKYGITDATFNQIDLLLQEQGATDGVRNSILAAIEAMRIFKSSDLGVSEKITAMESLIATTCGLDAAIDFANKTGGYDDKGNKLNTVGDEALEIAQDIILKTRNMSFGSPHTPKTPTTGGSTKSPDKQPEKKEFKESFNWLERFIKRLKSSFDKWLAQAETALTNGFLNIYYQKAASLAKSQLSTYSSAYNKDMEKANAIGLDEKYAEKVRNGALDIDTIEDEGLAKKIKEYQDWYDKAQDSMDSFREIAEKLYNLPLDKAAKKVDIFSNAIDLLNKELDNKTKYTEKNKIIDKQTTKEKQTLNAYKKAEKETKKSLSSAKKELLKNQNLDGDDGITARERKMIQKSVRKNKEVNLSRFTENSAGYQAAVKYNEALKARKKAGNDRQSAQQDYNRWKVEASKLKFDNIAGHYDKKIKRAGYRTSAKDNKMSELEAAGRKVNISYYKAKKTSTQKNLNQYEAEKKDLEKSLTHIKKYTDEWYDAKDQIQQVSASISDCVKETYELNNAINQLHFDMFDDISDSISRIITEQEFLQGLFAHEKSTDAETGKFTEAGLARLGSLSTSYYASKNNADRDKTEVDELRRMLDSGTLHSNTLGITFNSVDDLQKKLSETYTKWQDDIKQTHSLESALADIVKEKYQAELDKLQELINARKEAMNAEKDLHDYQRTISQKTRDIATVRKQIAAYSGDTSEEGRAKLQRLQKELDDKEDDLRETEYNRLISDQQAMLDKLYEQYRELTEKKMDDFHGLVEEGHRMAQENAGIISSYLSNIATANDYKEENKSLLAGISTSISGNVDNIIQAIVDSRTALSGTKDNNEGTKNNNDKKNNNKKKSSTNKKNNNKKKSSSSKKKSSNSKKNGSSKQEVVLEGSSFKRIPTEKDTLKNLGFSHLEPDILFEDYHGRGSLKQASLEQEVMILNTMERTSDIYAAPDTRKPRILSGNMLDAPIQTLSISDVVPDLTATPSINSLSNVVNIDSITLPNVTNYDEFKDRMFHDMQNNGNYIRFVNDTSLNRTDGMGRLAKNTQTL